MRLYGTDLKESKALTVATTPITRLTSTLPNTTADLVFVEVTTLHRGDPIG